MNFHKKTIMMMKQNSLSILFLLFTTLVLSCSKSDDPTPQPEPEPDFEQIDEYTKKWKNGVIEITNYPVDSAKFEDPGYWQLYFDFKKSKFIPLDEVTAENWDLHFSAFRLQYVTANNGDYFREWLDETYMGYTSSRSIEMLPVLQPFFEITGAPQNADYTIYNEISSNDNTEDKYPQYWAQNINNELGYFSYVKPHPNRSYIYKLDNGQYVKFQMINVYKNPAEENGPNATPGYVSFRYYIAAEGSTDLTTAKIEE